MKRRIKEEATKRKIKTKGGAFIWTSNFFYRNRKQKLASTASNGFKEDGIVYFKQMRSSMSIHGTERVIK
jgi:hypothetical protein